jgi:hypothetical protein
VDENPGYAEILCDLASVLSTRTSKRRKTVTTAGQSRHAYSIIT